MRLNFGQKDTLLKRVYKHLKCENSICLLFQKKKIMNFSPEKKKQTTTKNKYDY